MVARAQGGSKTFLVNCYSSPEVGNCLSIFSGLGKARVSIQYRQQIFMQDEDVAPDLKDFQAPALAERSPFCGSCCETDLTALGPDDFQC